MDEQTGKPHISESLCIGCGICINKCPHDALIIENLPSELETDMIPVSYTHLTLPTTCTV